jgi:UDP-N-acetylmuramoylalanine--D-glutamate ligase
MREEMTELFTNKNILVLGLAKSGLAVAKLLSRLGATVIVNEKKERNVCVGVDELESLGIPVICGSHPLELLDRGLFMLVKNPGIPYDIPFLEEAKKRGIPVVTEVEIAYLISEAPIIGITGSNGKTTTTTMIFEMLKKSTRNPIIAGNIGTVFCEVAENASAEDLIVAELSSFQLLGTEQFRPEISLLLNVFDAHLDYHHTKEHYVSAKAKLFANQTGEQVAVLNYDTEITKGISEKISSQVAWFSVKSEVPRGSYLQEQDIVFKDSKGNVTVILPLKEVKLIGEHNIENALAAVTVAMEAGASIRQIQEVLRSFQGVAHRLQFVRELHGVKFYNDSKATNSYATKKAIQAFPGSVVLIAGGLDRGEDFEELNDSFATHVKGIVAYGQIAEKISAVAKRKGVKHIVRVDNVEEAVSSASEIAQTGDIVLLSPAAASWDQFSSFEERGDMFTQTVHKLR